MLGQRRRVTVAGASVVAPTKPTLTAPSTGVDVYPGVTVTVSATVTAGQVPDRVDFVLDPGVSEVVVATDSATPFSQSWTPAQTVGSHTLVARFVYGSGYVDSDPINLVIFDPTVVASPDEWLRADTGTTIATGVSAWADHRGAGGYTVSQSTPGSQPTLVASAAAYNNQAVIDFDGTDDLLVGAANSAAPVLSSPGTLFVVFDVDAVGTNSANAYANEAIIADSATGNAGIGLISTPAVKPWRYDSVLGARQTSEAIAATTPIVLSSVTTGDAGAITTYKNGAGASTATIPNAASAVTGVLHVGGNYDSTHFMNGRIAEIISYGTALSDADRLRVERYMGARYGITVA